MTAEYVIAWEAGASAQIELFSPELDPDADNRDYRLKFSPPMRKTIRPPLAPLQLGKGHLNPLISSLNKLSEALDVRGPGAAAAGNPKPSILEQAQDAGGLLSMLIIPNDVQMELNGVELFLEIGVDEALLEYPWELLHDGVEFLCLKHSLGRFVNVSKVGIQGMTRPEPIGKKPLSVLLISVSTPQPRQLDGGKVDKYLPLPGVAQETRAIIDAVTKLEPDAEITVLDGLAATWSEVAKALKQQYHIVHYTGHAYFNSESPIDSSLVLYDQDMATGHIKNFCKKPPVLFFVNGCESTVGRGEGSQWKDRYDIFGLARAFLDTGSYLLGSRWKIGDEGAAEFAKAFYAELLQEKPIGRAIREARCACKKARPDDFSWASYVYYGDPRLLFRKVIPAAGP